MWRIFRTKKPKMKAAPAPYKRAAQSTPDFLKRIVRTVEEAWEIPDPNQYDHIYQGYIEDLQRPFLEIEKTRAQKVILAKQIAERMIEIAPDFFEKALSRSAFETGYFFVRGKSDGR